MFFGIREKRAALGRFTSDTCTACSKGTIYAFIRKTKYFVAFFINLIPLKTSYESVCKECGDVSEINSHTGKFTAKKEFSSENAKRNLIDVAKIAAVLVVIAAAVLLPLLLIRVPVATPEALKDLVSEDGTYNILDESGTVLGTIDVADGEKTLTFFNHIRVLKGEPGADGSFLMHEHYYEQLNAETGEAELKRMVDDPGVLQDKYQRDIRSYHYDVTADALGYARGVVDLTTIEYSPDKAVYPFVYYNDDGSTQYVTETLYIAAGYEVNAAFTGVADSALVQTISFEVATITDGHVIQRDVYLLDAAAMGLAQTSGLSPASTVDDFIAFVSDNAMTPIQSTTYQYYGDTQVPTQTSYAQPDATGAMQSVSQDYIITEKDGYYIMQAAE